MSNQKNNSGTDKPATTTEDTASSNVDAKRSKLTDIANGAFKGTKSQNSGNYLRGNRQAGGQ